MLEMWKSDLFFFLRLTFSICGSAAPPAGCFMHLQLKGNL